MWEGLIEKFFSESEVAGPLPPRGPQGLTLFSRKHRNMGIVDRYLENQGIVCEMCSIGNDRARIVRLEYASTMYMCVGCVRLVLTYLELKVAHPQAKWLMSRSEMAQWMDPNGHSGPKGPMAHDLRNRLARIGEDTKEILKLGMALQNGYSDRNLFIKDVRAKFSEALKVVEEYLVKTV